jgi:hypothetical protein
MQFFVRLLDSVWHLSSSQNILQDRSGKPAVSKLELYTRYTATLIGLMHDIGIKPSKRSPVSFVASNDEDTEIIPQRFDLNRFLGPPPIHNP